MFRSVSIKNYVTPQQLADMVVFTASPRAKTIRGRQFGVRRYEYAGVVGLRGT